MKTAVRFAFALGLAASPVVATQVMVSPAAAQKLPTASHAAFVLIEFDVKDPAAFKEYAAKVRATLKDYKGEFVMREKMDSLFGGKASNLSTISFPTVEDAKKWLASPELAKMRPERDKIADVRTYLVEKLD